ncbi:apyrase [Anaeramoeba ignava]|uniref:Apyrase n=1 Tax=Anaeramoeba ignava TaxID=1746090 RepID=A0A9Q0RAD4_ANAIG|nr:apyrase [Anaeramoeba ignava]
MNPIIFAKYQWKNNKKGIVVIFTILLFFSIVFLYSGKPISAFTEEAKDTYRIAIISDPDTDSKIDEYKWESILKTGYLKRNKDKTYTLLWEKQINLTTRHSESGRGMELSELIMFEGKLLAFDDRTGIVYEIKDDQAFPRYILADGDGNNNKGFKCEWATVKNRQLYVGSIGKEYVSDGKILHYNPMWIKIIDKKGKISHVDWKEQYNVIRGATNSLYPSYQIHEAVNWNPTHQKWFFLPRKISHQPYDEVIDEMKGSNKLISVNEKFKDIEVIEVGEVNESRGFSSFKFIPGRPNEIIALKTQEVNGEVGSWILVFDIESKKFLLPETYIDEMKFEGVEFIPDV